MTTGEIRGEQWTQLSNPNGHCLHYLGSRTLLVQHRYLVAELNLYLNLLGPLLNGLPPGGFISYPGLRFFLGERKTHYAQEWLGRNLRFSQLSQCNSLPFLGMAPSSDRTALLRCVTQEVVSEVESEIVLN